MLQREREKIHYFSVVFLCVSAPLSFVPAGRCPECCPERYQYESLGTAAVPVRPVQPSRGFVSSPVAVSEPRCSNTSIVPPRAVFVASRAPVPGDAFESLLCGEEG